MSVTLVTGGSGFVGSHVVDLLLDRGVKVRVYDLSPERYRPTPPGVEFVAGSIDAAGDLRAALDGVDRVVHLASTHVPTTSALDPVADIAGNLTSTVRLLHMLRGRAIKKFVFLSSGGTVYGVPGSDPVREDHPLLPISSYGIVKAAIEGFVRLEHMTHGLPYVILRPSNPYGPRQGNIGLQGVIGTFLDCHMRGVEPELWGDGSPVRDFVFVEDLARLCALATLSPETGCFNAGSGRGASVLEVMHMVESLVGRPFKPRIKPARSFDVRRSVLDIGKATVTFPWQPTVELREGLARTWDWLQSTRDPDGVAAQLARDDAGAEARSFRSNISAAGTVADTATSG